MPSVCIVGPGRAGRSLAAALAAAGWPVGPLLARGDDPARAGSAADVVVIATPDDAVAAVAAAIPPRAGGVVMHLSGALGLEALAPHPRRASLHPLVPLPDPQVGAARLLGGATFAVSGDPVAGEVAAALGGRSIQVREEARTLYHAAASVAANHLVATLGQVARLAGLAGLTVHDFLPLARAALDDAARLGPREALTGPVARGDWSTVSRHLAALPPEEHAGYLGGVALALRLSSG